MGSGRRPTTYATGGESVTPGPGLRIGNHNVRTTDVKLANFLLSIPLVPALLVRRASLGSWLTH